MKVDLDKLGAEKSESNVGTIYHNNIDNQAKAIYYLVKELKAARAVLVHLNNIRFLGLPGLEQSLEKYEDVTK